MGRVVLDCRSEKKKGSGPFSNICLIVRGEGEEGKELSVGGPRSPNKKRGRRATKRGETRRLRAVQKKKKKNMSTSHNIHRTQGEGDPIRSLDRSRKRKRKKTTGKKGERHETTNNSNAKKKKGGAPWL